MTAGTGETYKRGQVEWALWKFFRQGRQPETEPRREFLTRIKRLLEIDRGDDLSAKSKTAHAKFAFYEDVPEGQGTDVGYRPFNAFCLALALDMLDMGFKQSEVVFLLRHIRNELEREFDDVQLSPPLDRQRVVAHHRPLSPVHPDRKNEADTRVFLVLRKVELTEVFGEPGKPALAPIITQPVYPRGIHELRKELDRMNADRRKAMVFEIAHAAAEIPQLLSSAPLTKRGRQ